MFIVLASEILRSHSTVEVHPRRFLTGYRYQGALKRWTRHRTDVDKQNVTKLCSMARRGEKALLTMMYG